MKNYFLTALSKITFGKVDLREKKIIQEYRYKISQNIAESLNFTVSQGPFKGLRLNKETYWGRGDLANKCLGFYEFAVQKLIKESQLEKRYSTFIDIGGADGFYACGCLINGLFDKTIVYELSDIGREMINKASENNGVIDKILIKGAVNKVQLVDDIAEGAFILCDIEGNEYSLFDRNTLLALSSCRIIIELHEFDTEMMEKSNRLIQSCKDYFDVTMIRPSYDSLDHPALNNLSDNDRFLILSEGRRKLAKWVYLQPKNT